MPTLGSLFCGHWYVLLYVFREPENSTKTIRQKLNSTKTIWLKHWSLALWNMPLTLTCSDWGPPILKKKIPAPGCFSFYSNCFSRIDLDLCCIVTVFLQCFVYFSYLIIHCTIQVFFTSFLDLRFYIFLNFAVILLVL